MTRIESFLERSMHWQIFLNNFKCLKDVLDALERIPDEYLYARNQIGSAMVENNNTTMQHSPSICGGFSQNTSAVSTPATSPNLIQALSYDHLMCIDGDQPIPKYHNFYQP